MPKVLQIDSRKGAGKVLGRPWGISLPHKGKALLQAGWTPCTARGSMPNLGPGGLQRLISSSAVFPAAVFSSAPDVSLSCQPGIAASVPFPVSSQHLTPFAFLCSVAQCLLPRVKTAYSSAVLGWNSNEDWILTAVSSGIQSKLSDTFALRDRGFSSVSYPN